MSSAKRAKADVPQTDLIPQPPAALTEQMVKDGPEQLDFMGSDAYNFLANVLSHQRTIDIHLVIAESASYLGNNEVATVAYREAIEMARTQGSTHVLKKIYLQQIRAYVDVRLLDSSLDASEAIENYLAINPTPNAEVLASHGVVKYNNGDLEGAIQAFQKSLELDRFAPYVGINLLLILFKNEDFVGMMKQLEYYGPPTTGTWLRACVDTEHFLRAILHAARATNKLDLLITIFEHVIQNPESVEDDSPTEVGGKVQQQARDVVRGRVVNRARSSMFRVYLGWLHYEYSGQHEKALDLWKLAFFQQNWFFKLTNLDSSAYSDIILYFFGVFSQLIYDHALASDPEESGLMLSFLEDLQTRERVFWKMEESAIQDVKITNMPLAKLYLTRGRKEQAQKMLNDQYCRAIEVLQDEIAWNDKYAYDALAKILFLNGQFEDAKIAVSLKRFSLTEYTRRQIVPSEENAQSAVHTSEKAAPEGTQIGSQELAKELSTGRIDEQPATSAEGDDEPARAEEVRRWERTGTCAGWHMCEDGYALCTTRTTYTCMACADVEFCEKCYDNLVNKTGKDRLYVCSPTHEFVMSPMEGLEEITDQTITLNGQDISITTWLEKVRKEWKKGMCFT
jgi:tetratricopeptide (TPR) repeat protein